MDENFYDDNQPLETYDNGSGQTNSPQAKNHNNRNIRKNNQRKNNNSSNNSRNKHNRQHQNNKKNQENKDNQEDKDNKENKDDNESSKGNKEDKRDGNNKKNDDSKIAKKAKLVIKKAIIKIVLIPILIIAFPLLLVFMLFIVLFSDESNYNGDNGAGYATAGYYPINCEEVTVIFTDKSKGYEVTGSGTYSLEDYVAGVLAGEVGEFNNLEVYKEYAIAARTYFLRNESECTIESSDRKQVFVDYSNSLMKQAAEETKGQVLLDDEGKLMMTEYDAFCSIAVDDNYYTIKQKNQKIPRSWVDSQTGIIPAWKEGTCKGNHGRGSSQWGSYYLATEKGYKYHQLLNYYYKSDNSNISISSPSFITSIANLNIKETTNAANTLNQPIESLLATKGGSLADYNNYIKKSVNDAGYGTRAGVVAGAVAMINYLYDNFNTKLPYYWGGAYQEEGIPSSFGTNVPSMPSPSGTRYQYKSFDCSGFTSWAVKNAGFKINRLTAAGFDRLVGSKNMCNITNSSCIGQPGDFISYKETHIKMIVSVDEANNKYYVAESTGSGVIITTQGMHTAGSVETNILHMDEFYNNQSNVNNVE